MLLRAEKKQSLASILTVTTWDILIRFFLMLELVVDLHDFYLKIDETKLVIKYMC